MEVRDPHIIEELRDLRQSNAELTELVRTMSGQISALMRIVDTPPEHRKLSIREAARRMKVSERTIHRHIGDKRLETFKEGGRTYTTEAAIIKLERRLREKS